MQGLACSLLILLNSQPGACYVSCSLGPLPGLTCPRTGSEDLSAGGCRIRCSGGRHFLPMLSGLGYSGQRSMSLSIFSLWSQGPQTTWSHTVCLSSSPRSTRKSCSRLEGDQTEIFSFPKLLIQHPELLKGSEVLQPRSACWLVGKLCSKVQKLREGYYFHTG